MNETERNRNDWVILLLFLLLGMLLMLYAGQRGTQLLANWNLRADVGSNLDPFGHQIDDSQGLAPLRPEILTPPVWGDTYLTPQGDSASATPPTFVVFDPSATPSATPTGTSTATAEPSVTATSTTVTVTVTTTRTKKPTWTPPTLPTTATVTGTASSTGLPSTIDPALTEISPTPDGINVGPPDGSNADGTDFPDGSYTLIDIGALVVNATPDDFYDLVFYENENTPGSILMDQVIIGITNDVLWLTYTYYEVFNWGDGIADTNTNVDISVMSPPPNPSSPPESDNAQIDTGQLYNQTGILIDVDTAPSTPPPGTYTTVIIIAPPVPPGPPADDSGQVDSVDVEEVPTP